MKAPVFVLACVLASPAVQARQFRVIDEHGFERPMTAATVELPDDWTLQSDIRWTGNPCGTYLWHVTAQSANGEAQMEALPTFQLSGSSDPMMQNSIATSIAQRAQFMGQSPYCGAALVRTLDEFVNDYFVPGFRQGAQVTRIDPDEQATAQARQQMQQMLAATPGMVRAFNAEVARVRLDYKVQGQQLSEWIWMQLTATEYNTMGYVDTRVTTLSLRAPTASIERYAPVLDTAVSTTTPDPQWQARVTQVQSQINQTAVNEAAKRSRIISNTNNEINDMIMQGYEQRQQTLDNVYERDSRARRGVGSYTDPTTGQSYDAEYGHERIWVNPYGEYVPGDNPDFDPNEGSDTRWTPAEPGNE